MYDATVNVTNVYNAILYPVSDFIFMTLEFYAIQQILFLIVRPSGGMVYRFSVVVVYELTYPTADA